MCRSSSRSDINKKCSSRLFERACRVIPGGVNSPVRACLGVGTDPLFIKAASGATVTDVDARVYIDYVNSWGPIILGHSSEVVNTAITRALCHGTSFGAPTELEVELAELVCELVPSVSMVRMVNSGTEACMSAIRLARAFTGRDYIIKFNGCYHGHADSLLIAAGSGVATQGIAGSPGIPEQVARLTVGVDYNNSELLDCVLRAIGYDKVAAVIVEPVAGNMGLVLPESGYLQALRDICNEHGIVLIFDEVMSGFRVALGGAQERFGVCPDLCTLGKVIGGGLPVGAFGGREDIMKMLAPSGPVYQAGTLSGNPLAMAAGLAQLKTLRDTFPYPAFEELSTRWVDGISQAAHKAGVAVSASQCGSMIGMFFSESTVKNYTDAKAADSERFKLFFRGMLDRGIYLAPSPFEAGFIGTAHTAELIDKTIDAAQEVFKSLSTAAT